MVAISISNNGTMVKIAVSSGSHTAWGGLTVVSRDMSPGISLIIFTTKEKVSSQRETATLANFDYSI